MLSVSTVLNHFVISQPILIIYTLSNKPYTTGRFAFYDILSVMHLICRKMPLHGSKIVLHGKNRKARSANANTAINYRVQIFRAAMILDTIHI